MPCAISSRSCGFILLWCYVLPLLSCPMLFLKADLPPRQNEAERMLMSHFPCVFFTSCSSETMCCLSIWAYHKRFNSQTIWCQSFYGFAGINRKKGVENSSPEAHSPKTIEKSLQSCPGWPPATSSEFPCSFELLNLQMLSLWEAS